MRAPLLLTVAMHAVFVLVWVRAGSSPRVNNPDGLVFEPISLYILPGRKPVPIERRSEPVTIRGMEPVDETGMLPDLDPAPPVQAEAVMVPAPLAAAPDPFAPSHTIHERAVAQAGKVDRELRGDQPLHLSLRPDSFTAKLAAGFAAAHKGDMMGKVDRYTAPDGVVYTRMRRGSEVRCYMSGTVNFVPGILHDSAKPQVVSCPPADAGWRG